MPHWTKGKTDKQRGEGVFDASIKALKMLNEVGYGMPDNPKLDLVYNPAAFYLATRRVWKKDFKKLCWKIFGIHFHNLFALTNLPISLFGLF